MASKHLMAALLGTALLSAPALAQTQSPAPAATPNAASSTMSAGNWMTQERAGQWRASKIEGLNVYNDANEKIGDISELLVDQTGKVEAVVIGVGGFLGMGEHDIAVSMDKLKFVEEPVRTSSTAPATSRDATTGTANPPANTTAPARNANVNDWVPDHAVMSATKEQLKALPQFKYSYYN